MSDTRPEVRPAQVTIRATPLARARGLGAAKSGVAHWWGMRLTSIALVPLSLWFVWSVIALGGASHEDMLAWIGRPVPVVLLLCLILATFHHMQAGLQVVIEDYVHNERTRVASLLLMKGFTVLLGLTAVVAVLKLA